MPNQAKRLFLSLKVGEVSLVDDPANEKPIIVAKRKEQDDMQTGSETAQTAKEPNTPAKEPNAPAAVTKSTTDDGEAEVVEVESDGSEEVTKAVQSLVDSILTITKGKTAAKADDKGKNMPPWMKKMSEKLKKSGASEDVITQAIEAAKSAFGESGIETTATTKAAAEVDSDTTREEATMAALEALQQSVAKAKAFTPKRQKELTGAVQKLVGLLEDLGIDKAAFGGSGIPATGTTSTGTPSMAPNPGGVGQPGNSIKKAEDETPPVDIAEAVTKALQPLIEKLGGVESRLATIEKARAAPTSEPVTGAGGGDAPVAKSKSIWTGVI